MKVCEVSRNRLEVDLRTFSIPMRPTMFNPLKHSGYFAYHQVQNPEISESVHIMHLSFCVDIRINSHYFPHRIKRLAFLMDP